MTRHGNLARRLFGYPVSRSPGPPVESLRCGALPAADMHEPPLTTAQFSEALREIALEERATRGRWEDGTPRTRRFGRGLIAYPAAATGTQLPRCEECAVDFAFADHLTAHRQDEHGEGVTDAPACPVCGGPMPMPGPGPTALYCSGMCWLAANRARRAREDG